MSLYSTDTRYNSDLPIYAPLPITVSSLTVSTLTANRITAVSTITGFIEGNYGEISNWYVDEKLYVNFQELTADSDQLFLNGVPVATTANLSSIQNWSYFAQVSTLDGNNQSTIGLSYLEASTIGTKNFTSSNIFTQNLMAFNIVNFTSTVIEVYESTIQSDVKLANISTANINNLYVSTGGFSTLNSVNGAFNTLSTGTASINTLTGNSGSFCNFTASSITVSSIVSPPVTAGSFSSITVVSNTNTGSLTVGSNDTTSFAAAPNFNAGANFYGTRPNFTTGIDSAGANNFNNCNLDNVGRITANTVFIGSSNYVNIQTSSFTAILNDRGADVGGNSVIDLKSRFGAATRVNITADASSSLAPTPTQIVSITANGATSLTQNAVGGRVSIVANAGSGAGCNILGFGQIDLTAYSSAPFAGVIKESAGSILAYSGLTVPAIGVPGGSFYSALTTLSLTCGTTPATTSYPGVVYLRGDNGTKVDNGFTADTITATGNSVLNTITTNGLTAFTGSSLAFFATSQNIQFNSATVGFNAVIAGPLSVSSITNVSTINGSPYVPGGGGGSASTISTFTNLTTSAFFVSSINGATLTNTLAMGSNPIILTDANHGLRFGLSLVGVDGPYLYGFAGGALGTTDGGNELKLTWNRNEVQSLKPLLMNDNPIKIRNDGSTGLAWGSVAPYSVGVDGPYLFGYSQGALGTTISTNDISLAWDNTKVEMYKPVDMNGNNISSDSNTVFSIGTNISVSNNITFSNYGGTLGDIKVKSYNIEIGDNQNGTISIASGGGGYITTVAQSTINTVSETVFTGGISRTLIGDLIPQPILQYGQVSSSGSSGSVVVQMPTRYTAVNTYLPFACMADYPAAEIYVSTLTRATFEIGWQNGGGGNQLFNWHTMGT